MTTAAPEAKNESADLAPDSIAREARVMIVDDEPLNVTVARKYLQKAGYERFTEVTDAADAVARVYEQEPDVLLLDLMMPVVSGLEILQTLRADRRLDSLPILILTASTDRETKAEALNLGATDFLAKPVDPVELAPRVRNALLMRNREHALERLVAKRTAELENSRREVIHCLARASEFRDNETGQHVLRVGKCVGILARELGFAEADAEQLELAATLHDIGKIGIPDAILLKPGKLNAEEYEAMQQHCGFGRRIVLAMDTDDYATFTGHAQIGVSLIGDCTSPILKLASTISLTHHEWWDGSGYPLGLAGEDIPIEGRITAVADVFDALTSRRPYKPAFPLERSLGILRDSRGTQFDPAVLDAFETRQAEILAVQTEFADEA